MIFFFSLGYLLPYCVYVFSFLYKITSSGCFFEPYYCYFILVSEPLYYTYIINDDVCGVEWSSQMIKKEEEVVLYFHYLYSSLFLDYLFVCVQKRIRAGKEGGYLISLHFTYKARRLKN